MSDYNSRLPVRTETDGDVVVKIADATIPSQQLAVDSAGKITTKLNDASGNAITSQVNGTQRALDVGIDVAGVQIDPRQVRALLATDVVTANQGSAAAITSAWPVKPTDGTNSQSYTAASEAKVSVTQPLPTGTNIIGAVKLDDGAGNAVTSQVNGAQRALDVGINVAGVQVDPRAIRALTATDVVQANIKDATGTSFSSTNPLPVTVTSGVPGTEVHDYNTVSSVAAGTTSNHDYTITVSKAFKAEKFWATSSGKIKVEVQVSTNGTVFTTKFVGFNSTATPNIDIFLGQFTLTDSGTGAKLRIIRTNLDKQPLDVYSTISGVEV